LLEITATTDLWDKEAVMAEDCVKEGLSEKGPVGPVGVDHTRKEPAQLPKKGTEKVKNGDKTFTIR